MEFIINLGRDDTPKNPIVIDINKTADALKTTTEVKFETSGGTNEKVEQQSETDTGDATFVYGSIQLDKKECVKGKTCDVTATVTVYCGADCKADADKDDKIKALVDKLGEPYSGASGQYVDSEINKNSISGGESPLTDGANKGKKDGENSGKSVFEIKKDTTITGDDIYIKALGSQNIKVTEKLNTKWHGYGSEGEVLGDEKDGDESKGHNTQKRITW